MAIRAIHIITRWETHWSPFDRMWFLSSVKACERPRPRLLCKRWVHEWRKWQGEIIGRLPKGELHAKRQHGGGGKIRSLHCQACCKVWTLDSGLLPSCRLWILNVDPQVLKMACMPKHHRSLWMTAAGDLFPETFHHLPPLRHWVFYMPESISVLTCMFISVFF